MIDFLKEEFRKTYKEEPQYGFFAPGCVDLMGANAACNGGTALTAAVSPGTRLLISRNDKNKFVLRTLNFDDYAEVMVSGHYRRTTTGWINYPLGIINRFAEEGHPLSGLNMLFHCDIPPGLGLSVSASMEVATACALNHIFRAGYGKLELTKLVGRAENEFLGIRREMPDPYTIVFGEKDTALALDCLEESHKEVPCRLGEYTLLAVSTGKPRSRPVYRYNEWSVRCGQALEALGRETGIQGLCELSLDQFEDLSHLIRDPPAVRAARYIVEENVRVMHAIRALAGHDIEQLGQLMSDSHFALRELYETAGREPDTIVEASRKDYVAGARATGSGKCVIALVHQTSMKKYRRHIVTEYRKITGYEPQLFPVKIGRGAGPVVSGPLK